MTISEFLTRLRKINVTLTADSGQLIFAGPKGALTPLLRTEINERKGEILDFLANAENRARPRQTNLPRVSRDENLPLSFAQQRLWFLDQLEPGSPVYNVTGALRIQGPLDVRVLERALNEIIRRHEALRTTFSVLEDEPVQIIAPSLSLALPVIDVSYDSEERREDEALLLAAEEARKPFDLRQGPLFCATLLRLAESDHVLVLTMHHIVSDGWSMAVLYRELSDLYEAFRTGAPSPLTDPPIQYADFAAWQRNSLRGEVLEAQLSYWKKQLDGVPSVLNLPTDRPRPARQSYRGARQSIDLPIELTQKLKVLSRKEGATLYMTLLAAFQVLLHRYTGQEDVVVGSPIANRNRVEIEGLIGFFVNTLALRTRLSGNPRFCDVLRRVRETALEAYAHQDLPFEKLVEELRPDRDLSRSPLFQAMFVFQNAPSRELKLKDLSVTPMRIRSETTKFDLTLTASEEAAGLRFGLQYSTDLFDEATIERMLGHFKVLLESVVADPEASIDDLALLTGGERRRLSGWSKAPRVYRPEKCLHQLFEEQARRTPDAVAVVFEGEEVTYGALDRWADSVARSLQEAGVGRHELVGLYVERSVELVIGILGILKAGGAYVPLDPSYPKERLDYMVKDSAARVIVMQRHLAGSISTQGAAVLWVSAEQRRAVSERPGQASDLESAAAPEAPAYVIYTSGSTGTPKGVVVTHRNVVRLFQATQDRFNFSSSDVWSLFHSYAFDFSVWEMWGALLNGGRLIVVPHGVTRSPEDFAALMKKSGITVLNQTPSAFRQLMPYLVAMGPTERTALRYVIFGGEALDLRSLQPWFERYGDDAPRLINMYGITETTVHVTYRRIAASDLDSATGSMIGSPISDLSVYVLDRNGQMQPTGIPGEIYVGGGGVAAGYLGNPELTMQRFVADRFGADPQARLYRSGDLARWLPSGELEYLGRTDDQVKIRGYRIELGEIEAALLQCPGIREAAVIAREDTANDRRLFAYVVGEPTAHLASGELRVYLKEKLPDYMVPNAFVFLDSLPLTPSGKVDRQALPPPVDSRPDLGEIYAPPGTRLEHLLARIWQEVLKVRKVGIHDNFFDLGGHSLLATQVMSRICRGVQRHIPLRSLFQASTIRELASLIEKSDESHDDPPAPTITPVSRDMYRLNRQK